MRGWGAGGWPGVEDPDGQVGGGGEDSGFVTLHMKRFQQVSCLYVRNWLQSQQSPKGQSIGNTENEEA